MNGKEYIIYTIVEYDSDFTDIEVETRSAHEPERAYLRHIAEQCVEDYFSDRMEDCKGVTVRFESPPQSKLWHEMYVSPEYSVQFVAESYKPLTQKDVIGEEV